MLVKILMAILTAITETPAWLFWSVMLVLFAFFGMGAIGLFVGGTIVYVLVGWVVGLLKLIDEDRKHHKD